MTKEEIDQLLTIYALGVKDTLGRNFGETAALAQQVHGTLIMAQMLGEIAIQLADLTHHLRVRDGAVQ